MDAVRLSLKLRMRFYKFLTEGEREKLVDSFLILIKSFRRNKNKFPKEHHKEIKGLITHMAETLYINIDDNMTDSRIRQLNKKYSHKN